MFDFKVLQYLTKKCFKILGKVNIIKDPAGIVIMTYKFVFKVLPSCSTLLGNKFFVLKNHQFILYFIVDFERQYVTIRRFPLPP